MQETTPYILVGYRFMPSDEELVEYYLYQKVSGIPIPFVDYVVKECDIYDDEPGKIWNSYGGNLLKDDEDLYFFTKLKKRTPKGSRIDRKVGLDGGAWQGEDAPTEIVSSKTQRLIGSKKRFRYEKEGSDDNGCWIMHEYTLHASLMGKNQSTNCVLCRIRKNQQTGKKNQQTRKSKKRKVEDFQKCTQSVEAEPERFVTKQENKQVACIKNVASQSSEASMVTMVQEEASCNTDMIGEEGREAGEIDYSSVAGAGQYEVAVPDQGFQTLAMVQSERMLSQEQNQQQMFVNDIESQYEVTLEMMRQKILSDANRRFQGGETGGMDSIDFSDQCQAPVVVVRDHQTVMLHQDNESDPLSGISDEDICLLRKMFDQQPNEESVPSASFDCVTMGCTGEELSDHPNLLYEEYVFFPGDDGETAGAGSTSSIADQTMMLHQQECSDSDPLFGIELVDEEFCPLREAWIEELFKMKVAGPGKNGGSTGVNWENVQSTDELVSQIPGQQLASQENLVAPSACVECGVMQTMSELPQLCELPQLPSEENVIAFSDGEIARSGHVEWEATMQMQTADEMVNEVSQIVPCCRNFGISILCSQFTNDCF
ncbi:putative NAC domain-containing protein [Melia azedarach]|uniref:NAC domain-containing protein n=1 Tax=Melia azedarach TaxID=155640 RepID=A0ACC1YD24_MELAZ|nr:putative NAC domain-containing protein [Melia azedarach]